MEQNNKSTWKTEIHDLKKVGDEQKETQKSNGFLKDSWSFNSNAGGSSTQYGAHTKQQHKEGLPIGCSYYASLSHHIPLLFPLSPLFDSPLSLSAVCVYSTHDALSGQVCAALRQEHWMHIVNQKIRK